MKMVLTFESLWFWNVSFDRTAYILFLILTTSYSIQQISTALGKSKDDVGDVSLNLVTVNR